MGVFYLKYRDVNPVLEVVLKDPDNSVHDLTGATDWKLHIWLSDGTKLTRTMTVFGAASNGTLRYTWVATDWDTGNLVASPSLPLNPGVNEHRMEYEVIGPAPARMTFPNSTYDILRIVTDIGQGT